MSSEAPEKPFKVMEWLEGVQEEIQREIEGMTPEEVEQYFESAVENGPFAEMMRNIRKATQEPVPAGS